MSYDVATVWKVPFRLNVWPNARSVEPGFIASIVTACCAGGANASDFSVSTGCISLMLVIVMVVPLPAGMLVNWLMLLSVRV